MQEYLNYFMIFTENHKDISYLILFLGSMLESTFPISFFVYGEIFFLAGSILAGYGILDIYEVVISLIIGGILGDNLSYFLGKKYGNSFLKYIRNHKKLSKILSEEKYNKIKKFFQDKGGMGIVIARLSGPLAWMTPFIGGSFGLKYKTFLKYDVFGATIGISIFIIIGYFFGKNIGLILNFISNYLIILPVFLFLIVLVFYYLKNKIIGKKNI